MTATEVIERVLKTNVLKKSLTYVSERGATIQELSELSKHLPRPLSNTHLSILKRWNGLNLEILRIYGASPIPGELRGLSETQFPQLANLPDTIVFGDDPSGFIFAEAKGGEVISYDVSSDEMEIIATSLDDFFTRLVFGKDAAKFAGDKWLSELRRAGLA